jgi:uncharacterized protein DUF4389
MAEPGKPIRLTISDDLSRSRLTVFFRLLLAIPHFVWLTLWGIAVLVVAILNWFATLFTGRSPEPFHRFLAAYTRYSVHVGSFLYLAANPFPGFTGKRGSYPVDIDIDPPERQNRWVTLFRIFLVLPAALISSALIGGGGGFSSSAGSYSVSGGVGGLVAVFAWFVCLVRARMPRGFRELIAYGVGYGAQVTGYVFLLTDRYPTSDPAAYPVVEPSQQPIALAREDDLRRSRLTVFFRLLLALPHFVWLSLWAVVALLAGIVNGIATLIAGRSPDGLHNFLGCFIRYQAQVYAYAGLVANPFPGFLGRPRSYPVEVEIASSAEQNRWITFFRIILALPAMFIAAGFGLVLFLVAFLGWFSALARGKMPRGMANLGAYAVRYGAQTYGYFYVLTDRYPYTGPTQGELVEGSEAHVTPSA